MGVPFVRKYCPKAIKDIVAQESQMAVLKTFILNFKNQKKNAVIIHGPSGCGKTASVYALANDLGYEVVEMNASDFRKKDQINSIIGAAAQQRSLFGESKLILVDEMDGISGRKDRGGVPALVKIIKKSSYPIIITANNPYPNKFSSIRNKSELVEFKELEADDIFQVLKRICDEEKIKYEDSALKTLARRAGGDARGVVNDLEIISSLGNVSKKAIDELSERNKTDSIITALLKIFKTKDPNIAVSAFNTVEEDFDERFLWVDENLPKEYTNPADLARAYDKLSRADVFKGRIRRWQLWGFLRYVDNLMTAGIAVSKDKKYKEYTKYKPTGRILKMWWAKRRNAKKKAIAQKIAEKTHTSSRQVLQNIEYFQTIFKNNKEMGEKIAEELELGKEEVAWLKK